MLVLRIFDILKIISAILCLSIIISGCEKASMSDTTQQPSGMTGNSLPDYIQLKVGRVPYSALSADFNADGQTDIAVTGHGASDLRIFWGRQGRRFEPGPIFPEEIVGFHPGKATVVDWNRNERPDIVLACEGERKIQYWENKPGGLEKKAEFKVPFGPVGIAVSDLDNDGRLDVVLGPYSGDKVYVLWGLEEPFRFKIQQLEAAPTPIYIHLADWDGDGRQDILWAEWDVGSICVALNRGKRTFEKRYLRLKPKKRNDAPRTVVTADLDGDGNLDAIAPLETGMGALLMYGDGKGGVAGTDKIPAPVWGYSGIAAVSAGENHPAMVGLGEEGRNYVAVRSGEGKWNLKELTAGSLPRDLRFVDIDQDGYLDLLFANSAGSTIGIHYGPLYD